MKHILIVDDEPQIRLMLKKLLEFEGYKVTEAFDGNQALQRYRDDPPDLIITDLIMPEKEGLETMAELLKENPEVKIIAMSGGGKNKPVGYLHTAKLLGAVETFEKPIRKEDLLEAIKKIIR